MNRDMLVLQVKIVVVVVLIYSYIWNTGIYSENFKGECL